MKANTVRRAVGVVIWLTMLQTAVGFYNPNTGRWLNRDPIGEESGPNVNAVEGNSLVNHVDLLGMYTRDGRNITVGDCEVVVAYGHGSYEKPLKFKFEGDCTAAAAVMCWPDKQIETIPAEKRFENQPTFDTKCVWNCPRSGVIRKEVDRAEEDPDSGTMWDADRHFAKIIKELPEKVLDLCKCCDEIKVIFERIVVHKSDKENLPVYQNYTKKCKKQKPKPTVPVPPMPNPRIQS